jgi:hypothetical protein
MKSRASAPSSIPATGPASRMVHISAGRAGTYARAIARARRELMQKRTKKADTSGRYGYVQFHPPEIFLWTQTGPTGARVAKAFRFGLSLRL